MSAGSLWECPHGHPTTPHPDPWEHRRRLCAECGRSYPAGVCRFVKPYENVNERPPAPSAQRELL